MRSTRLPSWIEGLLGLDPLPAPPHAFTLAPARLRYVHLQRDEGGCFRIGNQASHPLPAGLFPSGPLGGPPQVVDALAEAVATLVSGAEQTVTEASLVLPDEWLRVTFVETGELPAAQDARDEVLRWKLKRLLPYRVEDLRLDALEVAPLPRQQEERRFLVAFAMESMVAALETAFSARGVRLGRVTNRSLAALSALSERLSEARLGALVVHHDQGYTLLFTRRGEPALFRYKTLDADDASGRSGVGRDLRLTRGFLEEHLSAPTPGPVVVLAPPSEARWWGEELRAGLEVEAQPLGLRELDLVDADGVSVAEAAAWVGVIAEEIR